VKNRLFDASCDQRRYDAQWRFGHHLDVKSKTTDYESARCIHAETIRRSAWNGIKNYHSSLPLYTLLCLKYFFCFFV
ncbi:hypothetical protein, partial [Gluconacetobacter dulcium]|uniref:hypothetical protein n=1 Tax=Gluconacetobacter dulcium TaxID=2729096 RepID=UPI001C8238F0